MQTVNFYICKHCGNLITKIHDAGVPVVCCGEKMSKLEAGITDAAVEKHLPVVNKKDNLITVSIGSTPHPMEKEHHIAWVYLQTQQGGQLKYLSINAQPTVTFTVDNDDPITIYAYCNLHGLWKTELQ